MININQNAALCTKVCAMSGRLLDAHDFEKMMNMQSVSAVAAYLAENATYSRSLKGINPMTLRRGRLERLLKENLKDDIKILTPFAKTGSKVFLGLLTIIDEIEKIKICLRLIHSGQIRYADEYISDIYAGKKQITHEMMAGIDGYDGFIRLLSGTPYSRPLKFFEGKPDRQRLFDMETALDAYLAETVLYYAKKYLPKNEVKIVLKAYGTVLDLENISFLLRCKQTFDMTEEEMYASIIPQYYRLRKETVAKIVKSGSLDEAAAIISRETPYAEAFAADDGFVGRGQRKYIAVMYRRLYRENRYSVWSAVYYIYRRRIEINNIISVIEGIRYGLAPNRISEYLTDIRGEMQM